MRVYIKHQRETLRARRRKTWQGISVSSEEVEKDAMSVTESEISDSEWESGSEFDSEREDDDLLVDSEFGDEHIPTDDGSQQPKCVSQQLCSLQFIYRFL
jgi:hypothetical protein